MITVKELNMSWYSQPGKHQPSFAKFISCLIALIMMGFMGFATIPFLFLYNYRFQNEAVDRYQNKLTPHVLAQNKKVIHGITNSPDKELDTVSGVTEAIFLSDYE